MIMSVILMTTLFHNCKELIYKEKVDADHFLGLKETIMS